MRKLTAKLTTEEFIERSVLAHGDRYDYSVSIYLGVDIKIKIICRLHGEFEQTPRLHWSSKEGCSKCSGNFNYNTKEFIDKAMFIHENKYDYSRVVYLNNHTKIKIICRLHGEFEQTPNNHLSKKHECPKCKGGKLSIIKRKSKLDFLKEASALHNNFYSYPDDIDYVNAFTKVQITCPVHGIFQTTPGSHLSMKSGCPVCSLSKGELKIRKQLEKLNIEYISQYSFKDPKYKRPLKFDFYLPDHNILIEFDGKQHFEYIPRFHRDKKVFLEQTRRDKTKDIYAKNNNINLIRIPYTKFSEIESILSEIH